MRIGISIFLVFLMPIHVLADDSEFIVNYNLEITRTDGSSSLRTQQLGIRLIADKPFHGIADKPSHGKDLGRYDYYLTVTTVDDGHGKLVIEVYEYESQRKTSDVVSEIVTDVDFAVGSPAIFQGNSELFGIDLMFKINST